PDSQYAFLSKYPPIVCFVANRASHVQGLTPCLESSTVVARRLCRGVDEAAQIGTRLAWIDGILDGESFRGPNSVRRPPAAPPRSRRLASFSSTSISMPRAA